MTTPLAPDQLALVRLMQMGHDYIEEWRHLFQGAMVRARTHRGRTCTVARDALQGLVDAGVLAPGYGEGFVLTETGKGL